jgi:hypothetical protein
MALRLLPHAPGELAASVMVPAPGLVASCASAVVTLGSL